LVQADILRFKKPTNAKPETVSIYLNQTTMYGLKDLKTAIVIEDNSVECPVRDCSVKVDRQRKSFKREQRYQCPKHNIFIVLAP